MNTNPRQFWKPGDVVLYRGVRHNLIEWALGVIIVQDSPEMIALFWRNGTPNIKPKTRPTPQDLLSTNIQLVHGRWKETDVLMLAKPGASHAIYVMWEAGQKNLQRWYIDLIEPLHRTNLGFDTTDHTLDIVISADKSKWEWKDEDEFTAEIELGVYSAEEARSIRAEGRRVINLFTSGQSPIHDGWENWKPPEDWAIPALPEGWDNLSDK